MRQFEMLQKAMNIGNELNRRAIEEVARVSNSSAQQPQIFKKRFYRV